MKNCSWVPGGMQCDFVLRPRSITVILEMSSGLHLQHVWTLDLRAAKCSSCLTPISTVVSLSQSSNFILKDKGWRETCHLHIDASYHSLLLSCSRPASEMNDYKWFICELWLAAPFLPADTKSQRKKSKARCWLIQTLILRTTSLPVSFK